VSQRKHTLNSSSTIWEYYQRTQGGLVLVAPDDEVQGDEAPANEVLYFQVEEEPALRARKEGIYIILKRKLRGKATLKPCGNRLYRPKSTSAIKVHQPHW
jgi:hypothetical protein